MDIYKNGIVFDWESEIFNRYDHFDEDQRLWVCDVCGDVEAATENEKDIASMLMLLESGIVLEIWR